jgi:hypothetical protein
MDLLKLEMANTTTDPASRMGAKRREFGLV